MSRMGDKTFGRIECRCRTVPCHGDFMDGGLRIRSREICMSPAFQNMSGAGHVRLNEPDGISVGLSFLF
jgi:hypothetical protein